MQDKNPDQCPVERVRPGLGGFYVQLSLTLQITCRSRSLNHVVLSTDSSDLFEAVIYHCLRIGSTGLTKVRDGKLVCFYIPFVQQAFLLFAQTVPAQGYCPFINVRCECCALHLNGCYLAADLGVHFSQTQPPGDFTPLMTGSHGLSCCRPWKCWERNWNLLYSKTCHFLRDSAVPFKHVPVGLGSSTRLSLAW